jgi:hypothetical protein
MFTFSAQNYNFKPKLCTTPTIILNDVSENKIPELGNAVLGCYFAFLLIALSLVSLILSLKAGRKVDSNKVILL